MDPDSKPSPSGLLRVGYVERVADDGTQRAPRGGAERGLSLVPYTTLPTRSMPPQLLIPRG